MTRSSSSRTSVDEWDAPEGAERWRRMMAWPVIPTVEDALAFAQNIQATMTVEGWDAMRAARDADGRVARDEAAEQAARAAKPRGR